MKVIAAALVLGLGAVLVQASMSMVDDGNEPQWATEYIIVDVPPDYDALVGVAIDHPIAGRIEVIFNRHEPSYQQGVVDVREFPDLNGDGVVDITDLMILLSNWTGEDPPPF